VRKYKLEWVETWGTVAECRREMAYTCFNGADSFGSMPGINWVICGGESGPKARSMDVEWARSLAAQCRLANVPFFMKQGSQANWPDFKDFEQFPLDLQVRAFPKVSE
jgi:hypothetical protein